MLPAHDYHLVLALGRRRYLPFPDNRYLVEVCEPSAEIVEVDFSHPQPTESLSA